jgi:hypothetical protein
MTPWWVAIVTFVGGSGVTLAVEWFRTLNARADRQEAAIERREDRVAESTARAEERQAVSAREHHGRQVATLQALQDVLSDYMRSRGEIEAFDRSAWRKAGSPSDKFPVSLLPEDLSDRNNDLQRRVQVLAKRVDDDDVRLGARELLRVSAVIASSIREAEQSMTEASNRFVDLNERIGLAIRAQRAIGSTAAEGDTPALPQSAESPQDVPKISQTTGDDRER